MKSTPSSSVEPSPVSLHSFSKMSMVSGHVHRDSRRDNDDRTRRAQRAIQLADTFLATLAFIALFAEDAIRSAAGDALGVSIAALICLVYSIRLARNWRKIRWMRMPLMLVAFLLSSGIGALFSFDMQNSFVEWAIQAATAGAAIGMAMLLPWPALVKALGTSVRWVLGLELVLELISVAIVRGPVLGLTGHTSVLSFVAVILLLVVPLQLAERTVWRGWAYTWIAIAIATLVYTSSPPAWAAIVVVAIVMGIVLWTRVSNPLRRGPIYGVMLVLVVGIVIAVVANWSSLSVATRGGSWGELATTSRPVAVAFFILLIITSTWRSWFVAVDRPQWDLNQSRAFTATSMLPLLLIAMLVTMGTFDAVLTSAAGLLLVCLSAVITKYPERLRGELR